MSQEIKLTLAILCLFARCINTKQNIYKQPRMQCYKLQLAYNGSKFSGLQSNGMFLRTIQDCVELAVNVSFPGLSIRINASGRTDAGVHSTGQIINLKLGRINKRCFDPVPYSRFTTTLNKASFALKKIDDFEQRVPILTELQKALDEVRVNTPEMCSSCTCSPSTDEKDGNTAVDPVSFNHFVRTTYTSACDESIPKHLSVDEVNVCPRAFLEPPKADILLHTLNSKIIMLFGTSFPIRFTDASFADAAFHARFSAYKRTYIYRIAFGAENAVFEKGRAWCVSLPPGRFNMARAREAARYFVGQHDFSAFRSSQCQAVIPVRSLDTVVVSRQPSFSEMLRGAPQVFDTDGLQQAELRELSDRAHGGTLSAAITAHTADRPLGWGLSASATEIGNAKRDLLDKIQNVQRKELEQALSYETLSDPRNSFVTVKKENDNSHTKHSSQDIEGEEDIRAGSVVTIELVARSYVHSQVRKIVGAIYAIATDPTIPISTLHEDLVNGKASAKTSALAPAEGLYLTQVLCADNEENKNWISHHGTVSMEMSRRQKLQWEEQKYGKDDTGLNEDKHNYALGSSNDTFENVQKERFLKTGHRGSPEELIRKYRGEMMVFTKALQQRSSVKPTKRGGVSKS